MLALRTQLPIHSFWRPLGAQDAICQILVALCVALNAYWLLVAIRISSRLLKILLAAAQYSFSSILSIREVVE
jgi:hypothetical protein